MIYIVVKNGKLYYEAISLEDAQKNCPINGTIKKVNEKELQHYYL